MGLIYRWNQNLIDEWWVEREVWRAPDRQERLNVPHKVATYEGSTVLFWGETIFNRCTPLILMNDNIMSAVYIESFIKQNINVLELIIDIPSSSFAFFNPCTDVDLPSSFHHVLFWRSLFQAWRRCRLNSSTHCICGLPLALSLITITNLTFVTACLFGGHHGLQIFISVGLFFLLRTWFMSLVVFTYFVFYLYVLHVKFDALWLVRSLSVCLYFLSESRYKLCKLLHAAHANFILLLISNWRFSVPSVTLWPRYVFSYTSFKF